MKKYFILSFFAITLIGCSKTLHESWNYFPNEVNLDTYNNLEFVKIRQGNSIKVKMEENASTGYTWKTQSDKDCAVSLDQGSFEQGGSGEDMVGVPGTKVFEIKGNQTGTCLVEFQQYAPGDDKKPANRKGIYFIVE